ncbi:VC0807 family protein [Umezawaea tangerina]|uniref:Intracellular septation protein A n=1 Tax=Umezawaea tangerina TaxID=84725 RepID=A0A2T0TDS7_9PSEU|nr:VC0807 family protein [Umezawaea tangerina]PRY43822.1 intracellular septation protein A [Umezawaea tangerina]
MDSRIKALLPTLLVDLALPIGGYYLLNHLGAPDWLSLTAGAATSGLVLLVGILRTRTVDAAATFMLALFAFGLLTLFLTGDARFVIAKDSLLSLAVGLVFLGSLFAERPLLLTLTARTAPAVADRYRDSPAVRRTVRFATILWGVGMLVDAVVRIPLAYTLPVDVMVVGSPALTIAIVGVLVLITRKYAARQRD